MWTILYPLLLLTLASSFPAPAASAALGPLPPRAQDARGDGLEDAGFAELQGLYRAALDEYANRVRDLRRQGVPPERWPETPSAAWIPRFRELAEGGSGRADLWILEHLGPRDAAGPEQRALALECLQRLVELHADRDFVLQAFDHLSRRGRLVDSQVAAAMLERLAESSNPEVAARAHFELAMLISDGLATEDAELLERAFGLLRIAIDGYGGTQGAVYAADRLFSRTRIQHWHDLTAWAEAVRELTREGTSPDQWPPLPVMRVHAEFLTMAQAGHPLAQQWVQVIHPAFEQAERRGLEHGLLEYANALSRHHHAGLRAAMDAKFGLLQVLVETWPDEALMFDLVQGLQEELVYFRADRYEPVLGALAERTSDDRIRYQAQFTRAQSLERSNREAEIERAAELYSSIQGEAPLERQRRQAELALRDLAKMLPGAPAPEVQADDSEGFAVDLRDYRGRVVLLAFWGLWDPASEELLPELNRLHERFAERPFALIGMNTDRRMPADFRSEMRRHGVTWRNAMLHHRHCDLCKLFGVHDFPMLVLVDAGGFLRARGLPLEGAAERIEELVRQAEEKVDGGAPGSGER